MTELINNNACVRLQHGAKSIIAKRSASVFSVGGVWPQFRLASGMQFVTNAICHTLAVQFVTLQECKQGSGLVHIHPFRLGMQLKVPVYKKSVHLRKFVVPSAVAALAVSLSRRHDGQNVMTARKKELGD